MKNKIIIFLLYLFIVVSFIIVIMGYMKLQKIQNNLRDGVIEFENKIDKEIENPTIPNSSDSFQEGSIGLLIVDEDYKVAIYEGVSEKSMLDGVAHSINSASLNTVGNCILYGHRDSAFRFLKDISKKDQITIQTMDSKEIYTVTSIKVVNPDDPSIFESSSKRKISLVTCYPFSFYGPALQRYLVEAIITP